jgi:metallophosphoesterase superfamily enzyme
MGEKMRSLNIMPIPNEPALYIEDKKMLIVSDLHIGIETELKKYGINAKSQTDNLTNKVITLCKNYNPQEILLLGDIKHNIPSISYQERKDVKEFLNKIKEFGELHIIPGNHDGNIKKILTKDIIIHSSNGYTNHLKTVGLKVVY